MTFMTVAKCMVSKVGYLVQIQITPSCVTLGKLFFCVLSHSSVVEIIKHMEYV